MFWIVEKSDGAILGFVSGTQSESCIDGPFESWDEAWDVKSSQYRSHGCTYYTIVESDEEPKYHSKDYTFTEAHYEFDDV